MSSYSNEIDALAPSASDSLQDNAKDLLSGAAGGVAQVLIGTKPVNRGNAPVSTDTQSRTALRYVIFCLSRGNYILLMRGSP